MHSPRHTRRFTAAILTSFLPGPLGALFALIAIYQAARVAMAAFSGPGALAAGGLLIALLPAVGGSFGWAVVAIAAALATGPMSRIRTRPAPIGA